tara:strand:+ start:377 stop:619 length:243 start_codon:yes stop_codon:yes gene_type:complete
MVKYQNNIVTFPIERQMDRIVREATRLEKQSYELLALQDKTQGNITGKLVTAYRKVYGERWYEMLRKHHPSNPIETHDSP